MTASRRALSTRRRGSPVAVPLRLRRPDRAPCGVDRARPSTSSSTWGRSTPRRTASCECSSSSTARRSSRGEAVDRLSAPRHREARRVTGATTRSARLWTAATTSPASTTSSRSLLPPRSSPRSRFLAARTGFACCGRAQPAREPPGLVRARWGSTRARWGRSSTRSATASTCSTSSRTSPVSA